MRRTNEKMTQVFSNNSLLLKVIMKKKERKQITLVYPDKRCRNTTAQHFSL